MVLDVGLGRRESARERGVVLARTRTRRYARTRTHAHAHTHAHTHTHTHTHTYTHTHTHVCGGTWVKNPAASTAPPGRSASTLCDGRGCAAAMLERYMHLSASAMQMQGGAGVTCRPFPTMPKCWAVETATCPW